MTHIARCASIALAAILAVAGCSQLARQPACPKCPGAPIPPGPARYLETPIDGLPGWRAATLAPSLKAFVAGCPRLRATAALARACDVANALPPDDEASARQFFESRFSAYAIVSPENTDSGLITGYYEPVIAGSREPSATYPYPILGVPDDLIDVDLAGVYPELNGMRLRGRLDGRRLIPYYSRAEIDARGSGVPAPVIAWAADPVELFFLQIQGSGQIQLEDGTKLRIGYANQNGYPYSSIGRYLVANGALPLEQASMQGIKDWAAAHPDELRRTLEHNASYVFFRELPAGGSPTGALGAPLSAKYSIAVDRRYIPLGAPVYLATTFPLSTDALERLVIAQDTGGAIRGAVRADLFWGSGPEAGALAGRMRQEGRMWLLWPRGEPLPRPLPSTVSSLSSGAPRCRASVAAPRC
jgi:membrane-bound lytic murein transglycosylase A